MSEPAASPCQTTLGRLLNGRLVLRQPARGHRAGTDALLLAAYAPVVSGHVIDAGAGVGTASLAYGLRAPAARLALLEIDPATAALAAENLVANRIDGEALAIDLMDASARRGAGLVNEAAALVLTNPPFLAAAAARVSPDPDRARAHAFSDEHGLAAWLRACLALLAPKGSFAMIHRADALGEILPLLAGRLGGLALRFVHPRSADRPACCCVG